MAVQAAREICRRCNGRGGWEGWPDFTCYRCGGDGREPLRDTERIRMRKDERDEARRLASDGICVRECPRCHVFSMLPPSPASCQNCAS